MTTNINIDVIGKDFNFQTSNFGLVIDFLVFLGKSDENTIERLSQSYTKIILDGKTLSSSFTSNGIEFKLSRP